MDFLKYHTSLSPSEFDKYTPPKGTALSASQVRKLQELIHQLPIDRNMLLYFWRFVFDINIKTIRRYADIENANGAIEALRFACKRYLELEKPISNLGMAKAFEQIMPEYEIVLVSASKGICWFSGKVLDARLVKSMRRGSLTMYSIFLKLLLLCGKIDLLDICVGTLHIKFLLFNFLIRRLSHGILG